MAKICNVSQYVLDRQVVRVKLPAKADGTNWKQGEFIVCESLVSGTRSTYQGEEVSATTDKPCIIINQGIYKDAHGNRTEGMVNPGHIEYKAGEVVTAIRPEVNTVFELTADCVSGTPTVGQFLVPDTVDLQKPKVVASTTTEKEAFKIEAVSFQGLGNGFESTMIVRTVLA